MVAGVGRGQPLAYTRTVLLRTFLAHRRVRRTAEYPVSELPGEYADADLPGSHEKDSAID